MQLGPLGRQGHQTAPELHVLGQGWHLLADRHLQHSEVAPHPCIPPTAPRPWRHRPGEGALKAAAPPTPSQGFCGV